jgi:hypothetical protein
MSLYDLSMRPKSINQSPERTTVDELAQAFPGDDGIGHSVAMEAGAQSWGQ